MKNWKNISDTAGVYNSRAHKKGQWCIVFLVSAILGLLLPGCTTVSKHGDAKIYDHPDFPFVAYDEFRLPKMNLGELRRHTFKVRNLPVKVYPRDFFMRVPEEESPLLKDARQPWRSVLLDITLQTTNGLKFFEKQLSLSITNTAFLAWGNDERVYFTVIAESQLLALPKLADYDVHVQVISASRRISTTRRVTDTGQFVAKTHIR